MSGLAFWVSGHVFWMIRGSALGLAGMRACDILVLVCNGVFRERVFPHPAEWEDFTPLHLPSFSTTPPSSSPPASPPPAAGAIIANFYESETHA